MIFNSSANAYRIKWNDAEKSNVCVLKAYPYKDSHTFSIERRHKIVMAQNKTTASATVERKGKKPKKSAEVMIKRATLDFKVGDEE